MVSRKIALTLEAKVSNIPGIGPKRAKTLEACGVKSVFDFLRTMPIRYDDRTKIVLLENLVPDKTKQGIFKARLKNVTTTHIKRNLSITKADFEDDSSIVCARWFNQPYVSRQLVIGKTYYLFGAGILQKGKSILDNPEVEAVTEKVSPTGNSDYLTAVYAKRKKFSDARISPGILRNIINKILDNITWEESFPNLCKDAPFGPIKQAFIDIHRPKTEKIANNAAFTMAFLDQLLFQMGVLKRREALSGQLTLPQQIDVSAIRIPEYKLPFKLTLSQEKVIKEILHDIDLKGSDSKPMNRLLQGDVGSGKTLVAFLAMLHFVSKIEENTQCTFMAPTEILARQHLQSFITFFPSETNQTALLTGSIKAKERRLINDRLETGQIKYIFGTHALFQESVKFSNLGFCVIDEQQRFGVSHRKALVNKGKNPHQLLLSATPIPRTLSLTVFGDMDVSIIDELPPGRVPIETQIVTDWNKVSDAINDTINQWKQVYVVCPLITSSEKLDWVSVEEVFDRLCEEFPNNAISCLTGRQKWDEKEQIMAQFKEGAIQIIIATTVVEVGIDCPEATLMIIENADRFGLSQLHQLRGRVGRGKDQSLCLLVHNHLEENERLGILASTNDGFKLSVEDLRLRGAGDLVGTRQSGLSHPCFAHNFPLKMVVNARKRAFEILTTEKKETQDWFIKNMINSFGDVYETFMEGG